MKGKVYIGHMSGGLVGGVRIDSVEIRDDEDSVFFASGPITVSYDPRDLFDRRISLLRTKKIFQRKHICSDYRFYSVLEFISDHGSFRFSY